MNERTEITYDIISEKDRVYWSRVDSAKEVKDWLEWAKSAYKGKRFLVVRRTIKTTAKEFTAEEFINE